MECLRKEQSFHRKNFIGSFDAKLINHGNIGESKCG
jgi:hypothetical protein